MADEKLNLQEIVGTEAWTALVNQFMADLAAMEKRKEQLKATLKEMATYSTRFQAEIVASNEKIELLMVNGHTAEAKVAKQKSETILSGIAEEMLKNSELWKQMTGQLSDLTLGQLTRTYKDARQLLDFLDGHKGATPPAGMDAEQLANIDKNSEAFKNFRKEVGNLHDEFAKKGSIEAFYADLKRGFDLIGEGFSTPRKEGGIGLMIEGLGVIQGCWDNVKGQVKQIGKDLSSICEDDSIGYAIESTIQMVDAGMKGLGGIAQMATGDILGGAMNVISSVATFFSIGQKVKAENAKLRKELHDSELKSYLAEFEINKLYRERYDWAKKISESTLQHIARRGTEMTGQLAANEAEQKELEAQLMGTQYVAGERYKHGTWFRKGKIIKTMGSLEGKTWEEIELLAKQGKLSEDGQKYYEALKAAREEGEKLSQSQQEYLEEVRETFTGSSYDSVVTSIIDGFKAGKKSAADFADTFQSLMKNAVTQSLKLMADEKVRQWYEHFAEASQSGGELTAEEQERLRKEWDELMAQLSDEEARLRAVTGIDVSTAQKDEKQTEGLRGEISEKITENTASKLEGLFRLGVDLQSRIASLGADQLSTAQSSLVQVADIARSNIAIEENTRRTADNTDGLRERLDTVAGELRAIKANTAGKQVWAQS